MSQVDFGRWEAEHRQALIQSLLAWTPAVMTGILRFGDPVVPAAVSVAVVVLGWLAVLQVRTAYTFTAVGCYLFLLARLYSDWPVALLPLSGLVLVIPWHIQASRANQMWREFPRAPADLLLFSTVPRPASPVAQVPVVPHRPAGGRLRVRGYWAAALATAALGVAGFFAADRWKIDFLRSTALQISIFGVLFWLYMARRADVRDERDVVRSDPRQPILVLRSFTADPFLRSITLGGGSPRSKGDEILAPLKSVGPLVSLVPPQSSTSSESIAPLSIRSGEQWTSVVTSQMSDTVAIYVLISSLTEGLLWELEHLFMHPECLSKSVLVFHEVDLDRARNQFARFLEEISCYSPSARALAAEFGDRPLLIRFTTSGQPWVVKGDTWLARDEIFRLYVLAPSLDPVSASFKQGGGEARGNASITGVGY